MSESAEDCDSVVEQLRLSICGIVVGGIRSSSAGNPGSVPVMTIVLLIVADRRCSGQSVTRCHHSLC
jgi:hypothetical protein